jgi:hypothetical protein
MKPPRRFLSLPDRARDFATLIKSAAMTLQVIEMFVWPRNNAQPRFSVGISGAAKASKRWKMTKESE